MTYNVFVGTLNLAQLNSTQLLFLRSYLSLLLCIASFCHRSCRCCITVMCADSADSH